MYSEFLKKFNEAISLENVKYYYHVTNQNPELIMSEGLFLIGDIIEQVAIEIPDEFKENPIKYIEGEKGLGYRKNPSIIIISIDIDELDCLIKPIDYYPTDWTLDMEPKNYIDPKYILGYINTDDYDLLLNDKFDLSNEIFLR